MTQLSRTLFRRGAATQIRLRRSEAARGGYEDDGRPDRLDGSRVGTNCLREAKDPIWTSRSGRGCLTPVRLPLADAPRAIRPRRQRDRAVLLGISRRDDARHRGIHRAVTTQFAMEGIFRTNVSLVSCWIMKSATSAREIRYPPRGMPSDTTR